VFKAVLGAFLPELVLLRRMAKAMLPVAKYLGYGQMLDVLCTCTILLPLYGPFPLPPLPARVASGPAAAVTGQVSGGRCRKGRLVGTYMSGLRIKDKTPPAAWFWRGLSLFY